MLNFRCLAGNQGPRQDAAMKTVEIEANIAAGGVLKLDHLPFEEGEKVVVSIVPKTPVTVDSAPRVLGLHEGKAWISEDFDDPLPADFLIRPS